MQAEEAAEDAKLTIKSLKALIGLVDEVNPEDADWIPFMSTRGADGNAPRERMVLPRDTCVLCN